MNWQKFRDSIARLLSKLRQSDSNRDAAATDYLKKIFETANRSTPKTIATATPKTSFCRPAGVSRLSPTPPSPGTATAA
jgi:hypothetical protein